MARPIFSKKEEALIARVTADNSTPVGTILIWSPWLVISAGAYLYGFFAANGACMFVGFMLAYYVLCYFVYYQAKPSWSMKPIIEKYEAACAGPVDASMGPDDGPKSTTA
jgi:hypothetical protein